MEEILALLVLKDKRILLLETQVAAGQQAVADLARQGAALREEIASLRCGLADDRK